MSVTYAAVQERTGSPGSSHNLDSFRISLNELTNRQRFLRAARGRPVDRPPIWMMRQAGRALPEYRKLKERFTFLELAQTPELAAEVTLQPIRRFDFDAAIIFSDILVIPEAMGVRYAFRETGGVEMEFPIQSAADVYKLSEDRITERLQYVAEAIRIVRSGLGNQTALLGFAGSPWTLANYMLDGGSTPTHSRALSLFWENRPLFNLLCGKLTRAVTAFLNMQIASGVDAIQVFDSLGGLIAAPDFHAASGAWIEEILAGIDSEVPSIVFSKGTRNWAELKQTKADVIGVDHGTTLGSAREALGRTIALQGNLAPALLVEETPAAVENRVEALLAEMHGENGFIFNLGHGLLPNSRLENIEAVVRTVRKQSAE